MVWAIPGWSIFSKDSRITQELGYMVKENVVAERIAIESFGDMIRYLGANDATKRRMIEQILAAEEEHADELADLLTRD